MDEPITGIALLVVVGGALATFWGQVKGAAMWLRSLVIVQATVSGEGVTPFWQYCWKYMTPGRIAIRRYTAIATYIRPKKRRGYVAVESPGTSLTFFKGMFPLFVGSDSQNRGQYQSAGEELVPGKQLTVSCLRGTFDLRSLIDQSVKEWDIQLTQANLPESYRAGGNRHAIRKRFGQRPDLLGGKGNDDGPTHLVDLRFSALVPMGYSWDELGAPLVKAPFNFLEYPDSIMKLRQKVRRWYESEDWYKDRGIPWRLGALLHGGPGTGKSSFVRAIAQELDLPVEILDLATMGNDDLARIWSQALARTPAVVLIEDIDRIFDKDKNMITERGGQGLPPLTMDCLLNCLSGIEPADGLFTCITANHPERLDPSLGIAVGDGSSRPGRLDLIVRFEVMSAECRHNLATKILRPHTDVVDEVVEAGEGETGAQFVKRCTDLAQEIYWRDNGHSNKKEE